MSGTSLLEWLSVFGETVSKCVVVSVWRTRAFEGVFEGESEWFRWVSVFEGGQIWVCESESNWFGCLRGSLGLKAWEWGVFESVWWKLESESVREWVYESESDEWGQILGFKWSENVFLKLSFRREFNKNVD